MRPGAAATLAPIALLVGAMASIQGGAALAKGLFPLLGPQGTTALRVSLAALILLIMWRPWRSPPPPQTRLWIVLFGAALGAMNLLFYMSIQRIPLGAAVALEFTGPLAVALIFSRRRLDLLWVALAAAGVLLLLPLAKAGPSLDPVGVALALAAGAGWGLYIVLGQKAGAQGPGQAVALGMVVAALVTLPFGGAAAAPAFSSPVALGIGLAVAVLSSALPYTLEMFALARMPKRTFGVLMSVEPAIASGMGLAFLGERLSLVQAAAIACVIAASAGSAIGARLGQAEGAAH